ncbi:MAG: hypothetical protein M3083_16975 [Actinomycetota bacterium]|nr:hypothetical protein [Actinomycetota bacterium]
MSDFEDRLRGELHEVADPVEPPPTLGQSIGARMWAGPAGPAGPPRALMVVAAAIVVVAVAVAVLAARGHNGNRVLTQGTSTTIGLGVAPGAPGVTVTAAPPVSDTTPVTAAPTTTATTMVNPTTTAGTTTTTTVAVADCATGDLQAVTTTDRSTYTSGQFVNISVTVKNVSANRCQIQNPFPNPFVIPISISRGSTVVWQPGSTVNGVVARVPPKVLAPDESYGWTSVQWNQRMCVAPSCSDKGPDSPLVPPVTGTYTATPQNAPGTVTPAVFTVTKP